MKKTRHSRRFVYRRCRARPSATGRERESHSPERKAGAVPDERFWTHRRIDSARHVVEMTAFLAAGIWAFYTFIYEERIKPSHEPLASVETVEMTREGHIRDLDVIRVKITIRNVGKTEFDTVAQKLDVFGYRYGTVNRTDALSRGVYVTTESARPAQKQLVLSRVQLYDGATTGVAGLHNIVEPDSETGGAYLIAIPHGRYDLLRAHFEYWPHKTPITERFSMKVTRSADGSFQVTENTGGVLEDNVETELALTQR